MFTTGLIIGVIAGLIVGWNFLPQPAWIAERVAKVTEKIKKKISGE